MGWRWWERLYQQHQRVGRDLFGADDRRRSRRHESGRARIISRRISGRHAGRIPSGEQRLGRFGLTGGNTIRSCKIGNELLARIFVGIFTQRRLRRSGFFAPASRSKQHEFGRTFGRPVVIPKSTMGATRHFLYDIGRFIFHSGSTGTVVTYPTDGFKNGTFPNCWASRWASMPGTSGGRSDL